MTITKTCVGVGGAVAGGLGFVDGALAGLVVEAGVGLVSTLATGVDVGRAPVEALEPHPAVRMTAMAARATRGIHGGIGAV
jgi:hypothetical protein